MENLVIKGSHDVFFVPSVNFDAATGECEISGESYLENTYKFYYPLIEWIKQYVEEVNGPITLTFRLTYFNSSSSKSFLDLLNVLKKYEEQGGNITVNWYYDEEDIDEEDIEDYIIDTGVEINKFPLTK